MSHFPTTRNIRVGQRVVPFHRPPSEIPQYKLNRDWSLIKTWENDPTILN
jgi:hypothetical protein